MVTEGVKAVKSTKFQNSFSLRSNKDFSCLFLILLNKIDTEIDSNKEYSGIFFSNNYNFVEYYNRILQKLYTAVIAKTELCSHSEATHARNDISILQLFHTIAVEFLCTSTFIWT